MLIWLLIILGLIISFCIIPPIGPIVYLVSLILLAIFAKVFRGSISTSAKTLNVMSNKTSVLPNWAVFVLGILLYSCFTLCFYHLEVDSGVAVFYSFFLSCVIISLIGSIYKKHLKRSYNKFLYSAVEQHFDTLFAKHKELVYIGDYGETIYDKWYEEIEHFIEGVIKKQKSKVIPTDEELKKNIIKIFDKMNIASSVKLSELKEKGVLTQEEFDKQKAEYLNCSSFENKKKNILKTMQQVILLPLVGMFVLLIGVFIYSFVSSKIENNNEELSMAFYDAVRNRQPEDSLDNIKQLLAQGVNINPKWEIGDDYTPFLIAVLNDDINLVQLLIQNKVDVNVVIGSRSGNELNSLSLAIENGNLDMLRLLMRSGADVNAKLKDSDGCQVPLLINAFYHSPNPEIITEILNSGVNTSDVLGIVENMVRKGHARNRFMDKNFPIFLNFIARS